MSEQESRSRRAKSNGGPSDAEILRRTSRTFALSIRVLPRRLRAPVEIAYLLARAGDTIADTRLVPLDARAARLRALRDAVETGGHLDAPVAEAGGGESRAADAVAAAERALLSRIDELLVRQRALPSDDREDVARVVARLVSTMEWELATFAGASAERPKALPDAATLIEYTEGIAGCVGTFWTRLVDRHVRPWPPARAAALEVEGRRFGRGLQLVNVLRDVPRDLERGHVYLPADELRAVGIGPADLADPASLPALRPVLKRWSATSRRGLVSGLVYAAHLPVARWGLRVATALPAPLGLETLEALWTDEGWLDPRSPIRIGRGRVRKLLAACALLCVCPRGPLRLARSGTRRRLI